MATAIFIVLHLCALIFGMWGLVITIPLHIIYVAVKDNKTTPPAARTGDEFTPNVRCPACRELVRADASKCKHCGSALTPAVTHPTE
jgi:hypothetical protein